jgi:hypothetical protein
MPQGGPAKLDLGSTGEDEGNPGEKEVLGQKTQAPLLPVDAAKNQQRHGNDRAHDQRGEHGAPALPQHQGFIHRP